MKLTHVYSILLFWVLGVPSETYAQSLHSQTVARIDSVFAHWGGTHSPGAVVGVIHKGRLVYKQAYGMANVRRKEKLSTEHAFWVASVAKQFTAMSIALLAESGRLSLEDDIRTYLPELPFMGDTVRIRHLIHHTSGLRDGFTLIGMQFKGEKHYTNRNVMQALSRQQQLNYKPGQRYEYNNGGYVLLAQIVEKVSGETLDAFTQKFIFRPLGMTQTRFYGEIHGDIPRLAQGYDVSYKKGKARYRPRHFKGNTSGSSGLVTTLDDLYKWDQNFYHNQLGKGDSALIKLITTPGKLNNGEAIPYAFGLEVEPHKGQPAVSHSGADEGYKAEIVRFPAQELTIVCLANTDDMYNMTHKLLSIGEWVLPAAFVSSTVHSANDGVAGSDFSSLTGYYLNPANLADLRVVSEKNAVLHAARSLNGYQERLQSLGFQTFTNKSTAEYKYYFTVSAPEQKAYLRYQTRAEGYTLHKLQTRSLKPAELKAFAGSYYSPELDKTYHLSVRRGKLGLKVYSLIHFRFEAMEGDLFLVDLAGNNSLTFTKDENGNITGFQFSREGIYNLRFIRK